MGCSKKQLQGMADGLKVVVTPVELDKEMEAYCVALGLQTYNIVGPAGCRYAFPRVGADLAKRHYPIYAEHGCGKPTRPVPKPRRRDPDGAQEGSFPF